MKTAFWVGAALLGVGLWSGCDRAHRMGRGFVFPEGNASRGQQAFVEMDCYKCHRVDGVAGLPAPVVSPERVVILGGKVAHVRTYGDLVTAIIHPQYELSEKLPNRTAYAESPMRAVNERMTVGQMLDIVTFLQPRYQQLEQPVAYQVR